MTLSPANAGLTVLECDDSDGLRLAGYNDTGHLQPAQVGPVHDGDRGRREDIG